MLLFNAPINQKVKITSIKDYRLKIILLKMGLQEGDIVFISEKLSNGPIVLNDRFQEIAIGNKNTRLIEVSPVYA